MTEQSQVIERVNELLSGYLEESGIELVDIIYRREQAGMTLRLLVDTSDGITIDECERLNNFLSEALDREGVIDEHYLLEVSSPGLDRPIMSDKDFTRAIGKKLDIGTYEPVDGKKEHSGKLLGIDKDNIVIESEGISTVIPRNKISRAKLRIEF